MTARVEVGRRCRRPDAVQTVADLHTLLERRHSGRTLAGHSFGGLYVLTFAANYPDRCGHGAAGLHRSGIGPPIKTVLRPGRSHLSVAAGRGSPRCDTGVPFIPPTILPPRSRDEARARSATASNLASFLNEFLEGSMAVHQAASLVDFADKPLIVVTAGREHDAAWLAAQDKLATLSTKSRHRIVADATHASLVLDRTDATAASQATRDIVASVRTSRPPTNGPTTLTCGHLSPDQFSIAED
jgi:pimeloyl-ACP methyl ester carboxylesterase